MKLWLKLLKSSMALLIALPLLYGGGSTGYAAAVGSESSAKANGAAKPLREGKRLGDSAVRKLANVHIRNYLAQDLQTRGMKLRAADSFLNVYDVDGNPFAYLVPLIDGDKEKEVGYITIGALEDGYDAYDINIGDGITGQIRSLLQAKGQGNSSQLVLIPPMQYLVKSTVDGAESFTEMTFDVNRPPVDVTDQIQRNRPEIQVIYGRIRSEDNKAHIQRNTEKAPEVSTLAVTKEDIALSTERNFDRFVPVEYSTGNYSYGGNQMWWPDGGQKENRGCGPVAAANITSYLAKITSPTKYGNLFTKTMTNYTDFLAHMDTMYSYIDPGVLGETSVSSFASAVEKYATDKKVTLKRVTSDASFTLDNTANYVKAGLTIDSPVATLNLSKFSSYDYEWHWMTITKYYRDVNDNRWIAVSTWGQRRSINYRTHFDAITSFFSLGGGFMYFK